MLAAQGMWVEIDQRGDASAEPKYGGTYGRSISQLVGCLKCFLEKQRNIWVSLGKTETREKKRIIQEAKIPLSESLMSLLLLLQ